MDILSAAQTFEAILTLEREGLTRTAAFRQLAADTVATPSAVQSRFYDEARRRGGVPHVGRTVNVAASRQTGAGLHLVFQQYLTRLNSKRVTVEHMAKTERALARFHRHLLDEGVDPLAVPYHVAQGYFDGLVGEVSLQTVKKTHLTAISAAYRFAQDLGTAVANPAKLVVLPEQADEAPATYTNDELRRMLEAVETAQEDLCLHAFTYTGMRRFEVLQVRLDEIDWEANFIPVLGKGRPRKLRMVPIHPTLRQALILAVGRSHDGQVYLIESNRRQAMGRDRLTQILRAVAERAGVEWKGTKAFRKTVSSVLYEEGARESYIEAILGHAPRTVNARHYRRVPDQKLQETILLLYRSDPLESHPPARLERGRRSSKIGQPRRTYTALHRS
jgi:integrase